MSILLDNKLLAVTEQKIEAGMTPDARDQYLKVVVAGMKIGLDGGPNGQLAKLLQNSKEPLKDCAEGAVNLVMVLRRGARGVMPLKAMIPGAFTLMLEALDVAERIGAVKVGNEELAQATKFFNDYLFKVLKITPEMLNKAAGAAYGVISDRDKMEVVKRRVGLVKDPRASTPTPLPEGEEQPAGMINA